MFKITIYEDEITITSPTQYNSVLLMIATYHWKTHIELLPKDHSDWIKTTGQELLINYLELCYEGIKAY